jgi:hypothetical protein
MEMENINREPEKEEININEIFENAMNDPSTFSTLDIDQLLDKIENETNAYLDGKSMNTITDEIYDKINELNLTTEYAKELCSKLIGYRYVDGINELHKGKHIRWLRTTSKEKILTNGGIVVNIKFLDNGIHVVSKNSQHLFIQIKFDECMIFQKLSVEEQIILMAYEYIDT